LGVWGDARSHAAHQRIERRGDDFVSGSHAAEDFHARTEVAPEFDLAQFDHAVFVDHSDLQALGAERQDACRKREFGRAAVMLAKRT
jgi:hypothetical protein